MKSKTTIEHQTKKKTNSTLVETIREAKKKSGWIQVAELLTGSRRKRIDINLGELSEGLKDGEKVVVCGKVLSQGEIGKKVEIIAFSFSKVAKEKLLNAGCGAFTILEEIERNPEGKNVRIIRK